MGAIYIILMIGGLILIHELGHYLLARWMGVHVVEFAIGVGPRIFTITGKQKDPDLPPTQFVIGLLPFGGYVKMLGFDPSEEVPDRQRAVSFPQKAVWRRFLIMAAGPAFNLILPFILFFFIGLGQGRLLDSTVGSADPAYPAWQAGIRPGDTIVSIDGEPIRYFWEMQRAVSGRAGQALPLTYDRLGQTHETVITPVTAVDRQIPGISSSKGLIGVRPTYPRPLVGVKAGSIAAAAGINNWDRIVAINGQRVEVLHLALAALERHADTPVEIGLLAYTPIEAEGISLAVATPRRITLPPSPEDPTRGLFSAECLVHRVIPGSPAAELGLQPGDELLQLDDRQCVSWLFTEGYLSERQDEAVQLTWRRGAETLTGSLTHRKMRWPTELDAGAERAIHGIIAQRQHQEPSLVDNEHRLAYATHMMIQGPVDAISKTLNMLGALLTGQVAVKDGLGGPVLIGQMAAKAGEAGWDKFFEMMAIISVSLGLINLLPIPLLDGGQILFLAIEGIRRKPVSVRVRMVATYLGLAFIIVLMVVVLRNDIARVWGG